MTEKNWVGGGGLRKSVIFRPRDKHGTEKREVVMIPVTRSTNLRYREVAQRSTDDVHWMLIQHCCAVDRVALISVVIDSATLSVVSANQFSIPSTDRALRSVDGFWTNERSSNSAVCSTDSASVSTAPNSGTTLLLVYY